MGHREPDGDFLGSSLALGKMLGGLGKHVDVVVSEKIPEIYQFLPFQENLKSGLDLTEGKILRIDTNRYPVGGMKYEKKENHLDIILEAEKNLKFEFVEIINGIPKPDLILVLDTPDVEKIDRAYDKNTELFFEVPVVNIDHHPGNEYFGSINLVDLTATSTAEILVSLTEALGIKIADPDTATCLLAGIISDTQSFRSGTTTPKSLTVAAQLLAGGGRQQEIISHLYKKTPMALLKLWGEMLSGISLDKTHRLAWTKVKIAQMNGRGISTTDVFDAADELLSNTPDADTILILCEKEKGNVAGKFKGAKGTNVLELAKLFGGDGTPTNANFEIKNGSLTDTEMKVLKKIHDFWAQQEGSFGKEVWEVIKKTEVTTEKSETLSVPQTVEEIEEVTPEELTKPKTEKEIQETTASKAQSEKPSVPKKEVKDAIDSALKSLEKDGDEGFSRVGEVIKKKQKEFATSDEEIDVFDEENE